MLSALRRMLAPEEKRTRYSSVVVGDEELPLYMEGLQLAQDIKTALSQESFKCNVEYGHAGVQTEAVVSPKPRSAPKAPSSVLLTSAPGPAALPNGPRSAISASALGLAAQKLRKAEEPPTAQPPKRCASSSGGANKDAAKARATGTNSAAESAPRPRPPLSAITANQLQAVMLRATTGGRAGQDAKPSAAPMTTSPDKANKKPRPTKVPFGSPELKAIRLRNTAQHKPAAAGQENVPAAGSSQAMRPKRGADQITGMNMDLLERALRARREKVKAMSLSPTRSSLSMASPEKAAPLMPNTRMLTRSGVKKRRQSRI